MYEATGKIKVIYPTQSFASGFTKREFVVTTAHDKYPQDLKFEVVKDKCQLLDQFDEGQDVTVSFDIRGNEYNGKYYVNLSAWKLQAGGEPQAAPAGAPARGKQAFPAPQRQAGNQAEPSAADLRKEDDYDDDDIPF